MKDELFYNYLQNIGNSLADMLDKKERNGFLEKYFKGFALEKKKNVSSNNSLQKGESSLLDKLSGLLERKQYSKGEYESGKNNDNKIEKDSSDNSRSEPDISDIGNYFEKLKGKRISLSPKLSSAGKDLSSLIEKRYLGENIPVENMRDLLKWALYERFRGIEE